MWRDVIKYMLILLVFFCVGFLRIYLLPEGNDAVTVSLPGVFLVTAPPQDKGNGQLLTILHEETKWEGKALLSTFSDFQYGDRIYLSGGEVFEGRIIFNASADLISPGQGNIFYRKVYKLRGVLEKRIDTLFSEPYGSLINGIVFGIEKDLGETLAERVKKSGIMHILVASGYNISIVIAYVFSVTRYFGRKVSLGVILFSILLYSLIAGAGPPIIRASIMGGATIMSIVFGRQKNAFMWLMLSAVVMLVISPSLIDSVSLHLSFGATLGILLLQSKIEALLVLFPKVLREEAATTIGATIFVIPILWYELGVMSPNSVLVNTLVIWMVPLIMFSAIVSLGISFLSTPLGQIIGFVPQILIKGILEVVYLFT